MHAGVNVRQQNLSLSNDCTWSETDIFFKLSKNMKKNAKLFVSITPYRSRLYKFFFFWCKPKLLSIHPFCSLLCNFDDQWPLHNNFFYFLKIKTTVSMIIFRCKTGWSLISIFLFSGHRKNAAHHHHHRHRHNHNHRSLIMIEGKKINFQ